MRVDKYLKVSRLIKRRTVAGDACDTGRIFVNGKEAKPATRVKVGDEIKITFGTKTVAVKVLATPERVRAEDAKTLYEVVSEA